MLITQFIAVIMFGRKRPKWLMYLFILPKGFIIHFTIWAMHVLFAGDLFIFSNRVNNCLINKQLCTVTESQLTLPLGPLTPFSPCKNKRSLVKNQKNDRKMSTEVWTWLYLCTLGSFYALDSCFTLCKANQMQIIWDKFPASCEIDFHRCAFYLLRRKACIRSKKSVQIHTECDDNAKHLSKTVFFFSWPDRNLMSLQKLFNINFLKRKKLFLDINYK